jgi:hypothetical protein
LTKLILIIANYGGLGGWVKQDRCQEPEAELTAIFQPVGLSEKDRGGNFSAIAIKSYNFEQDLCVPRNFD